MITKAEETWRREAIKDSERLRVLIKGEESIRMRIGMDLGVVKLSKQARQCRNRSSWDGSMMMTKGSMKAKGDLLKVNLLTSNVFDAWVLGIISLFAPNLLYATNVKRKGIWQRSVMQ